MSIKAWLSFSIPRDEEEFEAAKDGLKYKSLIGDLEDYIASRMDHGELDDCEFSVYEDVLSKIMSLAQESGVELF